MATSPPAPYPLTLPNSKKRPSISSQASQSGGASKRPKLHPLRQTSFPVASDAAVAYASAGQSARSETGSIANSAFSAVSDAKPKPRGRGRPRKSQQIPDEETRAARDGVSQSGKANAAKSVVSMRSGAGRGGEAEDPNADEVDDDKEVDEMLGEEDAVTAQEEEDRQVQRVTRLKEAMTEDQTDRYEAWRGGGLREAVVRRIVNQTVSQSVGKSQIDAVKFYSKQFVVEIIERAREVQEECAKAYEGTIKAIRQGRIDQLRKKEKELEDKEKTALEQGSKMPEFERRMLKRDIENLEKESKKYIPNKHNGGLLPDHVREALRRYKNDGDGGGVGFDGMSHPMLGVHGASTWRLGDGNTARRLFK